MVETIEIAIPYGTGVLRATVPAPNYQGTAIPVEKLSAVADEVEAVKCALAQPIESSQLSQLVHTGDKIAIIVSDQTRPTPSGLILGPVLAELQALGIQRGDITIVVACGLHAPSPDSSLKVMLGQAILDQYRVVNHDADDEKNLVPVGTTSAGIPVKINRIVAEADVRLAVGSIDPHRFAGWSGGAKNILPGVAARETVNAHHTLLLNPATRLGVIPGNPFRQQLEEAGRLAKLDFIINVVLTPERKIAYVAAGDFVAAHRAGVEYAHKRIQVAVTCKADIVVASPGGAPRDGEFWQTEGKCLGPVSSVVKAGGTLIVAAKCLKGIGNEEFACYLSSLDAQEMEDKLKKGPFSMALAKAYKFAKLADQVQIYLITEGIDASGFAKIPVRFSASLTEALQQVLKQNPTATVLAVPDAAGVVLNITDKKNVS